MSVKPVDFQIVIPRSVDAARTRSEELQKNEAVQQQQAAAVQNRAEDTLRQVCSRSKTEETRITERQRERGGQEEGRKKKEEGKKEDDRKDRNGKEYGGTVTSSRIDIRI